MKEELVNVVKGEIFLPWQKRPTGSRSRSPLLVLVREELCGLGVISLEFSPVILPSLSTYSLFDSLLKLKKECAGQLGLKCLYSPRKEGF